MTDARVKKLRKTHQFDRQAGALWLQAGPVGSCSGCALSGGDALACCTARHADAVELVRLLRRRRCRDCDGDAEDECDCQDEDLLFGHVSILRPRIRRRITLTAELVLPPQGGGGGVVAKNAPV